jgi:hypothetical protein
MVDDLFARPAVLRLHLEIPADALASLRLDPRRDVRVILSDGSQSFHNVSLHLKGVSSFRPVDDKPSFTLQFTRATPDRFHGQDKIHLNNSVEDPSYLNEMLGAAWFQDAGIPSPRVTHALVEVNNRKLGLFVLKEGFSQTFLARHFQGATGNLYEPQNGCDVDAPLLQTAGLMSTNQADCRTLAEAAREPDPALRWQRLNLVLDTDRFLTLLAVEVLIGHRDGYGMARNNWRLYHDPSSPHLVFLPHGMDQLFGKPDLNWEPQMNGLVARAILETPEGHRRYRERFTSLLENHFDPIQISNRVSQFLVPLRESLPAHQSREITRQAADLTKRIFARHQSLHQQLAAPELSPLVFRNDRAPVTDWRPVDIPAGGRMEITKSPDHQPALHIIAGPATAASWRSTVMLPPGRYRFEALAMLKDVIPISFSRNRGAGLRTSANTTNVPYNFVGTQPWFPLSTVFDLSQGAKVELLCELFAQSGEVWFDTASLVIVRLP